MAQAFDLDSLADLHASLLPGTITNAMAAPFYRERLRTHQSEHFDARQLPSLPITTKHELISAGDDARVALDDWVDEYYTGGTSSRPFAYAVSRTEQLFLKEFFSRPEFNGGFTKTPRVLRFADVAHAAYRDVPAAARTHLMSIYAPGSFDTARDFLVKTIDEPGVERRCGALLAGERVLRAFTQDTRLRFENGFSSSLRFAMSYGTYLTRAFRAVSESVWGVPLIDRYGISEAVGGATESPDCGWYHFDPCLIAEVVGYRSHKPITEGIGVVLLTALHPFQTAQPLIRYWTGDLAEVTHSRSSIPGRLAIKPLGRADLGVPDIFSDRWMLLPGPAYELVDGITAIQRIPWFLDSPNVDQSWGLGYPMYDLTHELLPSGRQCITLHVTLKAAESPRRAERFLRHSLHAMVESQGPWQHPFEVRVSNEADVRPHYGLSHLLNDPPNSASDPHC